MNYEQQPEQAKDLAAVVKKASNEPPSKRPRFETPSSLPTFKVWSFENFVRKKIS